MEVTYLPPWWRTDTYDLDLPFPPAFDDLAGPKGVAVVRAWKDGKTDPGWGAEFMPNYLAGKFNSRRVKLGVDKGGWQFAFIMRSLRMVCIDIDGKNGGLQAAKQLDPLPRTMAETSKSGDGYHLFYSVPDEWDEEKGFGMLPDRIGLVQGVDIRATGCVYHHAPQRWNREPVMPLPAHLLTRLQQHVQQAAAQKDRIVKIIQTQERHEILMMQDELLADLAKPIPAGRRNNTLFAIGSKMKLAEIDGWEQKIEKRATDVGLSADEVAKLIANVTRYA